MQLDYRSIIIEQSARFGELLRTGPLRARVPGCPDWDLGELGVHLVEVQRWAAHVVTVGVAAQPDGAPPEPYEAADALTEATSDLVTALDRANPDEPCWNFGSGPQVKSFWFRRQALEVAVHRWDAESALIVDPTPLAPQIAADVIDEFVTMNLARTIERDGIDLGSTDGYLQLEVTDLGESSVIGASGGWAFGIENGQLVVAPWPHPGALVVRGSASDVALFVYNRIGTAALEVAGTAQERAGWAPLFAL